MGHYDEQLGCVVHIATLGAMHSHVGWHCLIISLVYQIHRGTRR